jgi:hypothetical protein
VAATERVSRRVEGKAIELHLSGSKDDAGKSGSKDDAGKAIG